MTALLNDDPSGLTDRVAHWDGVYAGKNERETSWFEDRPTISLDLIGSFGLPGGSVIDVGGGVSHLVDALSEEGRDVAVLDVSDVALKIAKTRLDGRGKNVRWIHADVTKWSSDRLYDVWHDRAAFHFLTGVAEQKAYVGALLGSLKKGGAAIIATFALDGPERCSGLPVVRRDPDSFAGELGKNFQLVDVRRQSHVTPWGSVQQFQFSTFRRLL